MHQSPAPPPQEQVRDDGRTRTPREEHSDDRRSRHPDDDRLTEADLDRHLHEQRSEHARAPAAH